MAELKPFAALRYDTSKAGEIDRLVCPPYDIINRGEQERLMAASPYNAVRLELPSGDDPYAAARQTLNNWLDSGILKQDMDEGIYICEDEFTDLNGEKKVRHGIICLVKLEDPESHIVLPHENTLTDAEADRLKMLDTIGCNTSPVFALYNDRAGVTRRRISLLAKTCAPRYNFSDGNASHRLWVINDPVSITALCEDFSDRKLLIADGHHRYSAALKHRNSVRKAGGLFTGAEYIMMYLTDTDDDGLAVYPTHRLLDKSIAVSSEELLHSGQEYFDICDISDTQQDNFDIIFYNGDVKLGLYARLPNKTVVETLDEFVFKNIFNINPNSGGISYTHSADEAIAAVDSGKLACCFILRATAMAEIISTAEDGRKLPQKSTYFYPKPITGLTIYQMD